MSQELGPRGSKDAQEELDVWHLWLRIADNVILDQSMCSYRQWLQAEFLGRLPNSKT